MLIKGEIMKHTLYLENLRKELNEKELIRTFNSERYGDYIEFTERLNKNYIDKYEVIEGVEKDRYIDNYIKSRISNSEKDMDEITAKFLNKLSISSNFIDVTPYINRVENAI